MKMQLREIRKMEQQEDAKLIKESLFFILLPTILAILVAVAVANGQAVDDFAKKFSYFPVLWPTVGAGIILVCIGIIVKHLTRKR